MIPTTLPTDNLYKFMAIAGLVLFGVSIIFPVQQELVISSEIHRQTLEWYDLFSAMSEVDDEYPNWTMRDADSGNPAKAIERTQRDEIISGLCEEEKHLKRVASMAPDEDDKQYWFSLDFIKKTSKRKQRLDDAQYDRWVKSLSLADFSAMMKPKSELARKSLPKLFQLKVTLERLWELKKFLAQVLACCVAGIAIGLSLVLSGFYLWYVRCQRYQDSALSKEANYPVSLIERFALFLPLVVILGVLGPIRFWLPFAE